VRFATAVYSLLLWLYPPRFRERFGPDMLEVFQDRARAAGFGSLRLWALTILDVIRHAAAEWAGEWKRDSVAAMTPRGGRMGAFVQDIRYGVRAFVQRPGFTAVAVLTLAIGIGATTTIFSVVDAVLLKPLPYPDADRLFVLWESNDRRGMPYMNVAPPNFADWRARSRSFESMGVWRDQSFTLTGHGAAEQVHGAGMSHDLFEVLRVPPLMGRTFTASEDQPGGPPVVLVSHGFWRRWFNGRSDVIGQTVEINGMAHEVIGVMPAHFAFAPPVAFEGVPAPKVNELWTPLATNLPGGQRGAHYLLALGRLAPGVTTQAAEQELVGIAAQIASEHPDSNEEWSARIVPFARQVTGDQRPALLALSIAVSLVLLLACANVASLLLARGVGRRREMAIRVALGATRARVARQLLTESLLLSALGAVTGFLLASWLVRTIRALGGPMLPRLDEVTLDGRAIFFTMAACVSAALLFGLAPAFQVSRARANEWLKERGGSQRSARMQSALVIVELALSVVLLAGAALLGESFVRLTGTDPGFQVQQTLTAHVSLPRSRYQDAAARTAFADRMLERLRSAPGITAAGVIDALAIADDRQGTGFTIEKEAPTDDVTSANVNFSFVSPGYFEAMGIPLLAGRFFDGRDRPDSMPTIVINQSMARRYFGGRDPIGHRITMGFNTRAPRQIVGIVGDERHVSLDREAPAGVYVSYLQIPLASRLTIVARTAGDPSTATGLIRDAVGSVDPQLAIYDLRTMEQVVNDSVSRPRFSALLLGLFAATALLLAGIGVYGVISQLVGQRTQEFGVRMALGASAVDVGRLVITFGLRLAVIAALVGIPAALAFSRVLSGLLFGVDAANPVTYVAVSLVLVAVAALAALLPARRATRVDPLLALRAE
jgi:putative ABC transport system permease protein